MLIIDDGKDWCYRVDEKGRVTNRGHLYDVFEMIAEEVEEFFYTTIKGNDVEEWEASLHEIIKANLKGD